MKITQEFRVSRSPETVFEFFQDVPSVAQCLPGASLTEDRGGGVYTGVVSVKLGPMTARFEGEASVSSDAEACTGHITGKGIDKRGGSRGQVNVDYSISPADGGSQVVVDADITISGAAAQFGRTGLIKQMSQRLIMDFVACLEAKLQASDRTEAETIEAPDVKGVSLLASTIGSNIAAGAKKLLGRD